MVFLLPIVICTVYIPDARELMFNVLFTTSSIFTVCATSTCRPFISYTVILTVPVTWLVILAVVTSCAGLG